MECGDLSPLWLQCGFDYWPRVIDLRLESPTSRRIPRVCHGFAGADVFASVVTRLFHSAGVIDRSWGSSAAAITILRKLIITTNSSAAFGLAASSSLANCA